MERRPRLLALEREGAFLKGQQGEFQGRIAQAREAIAEAELQMVNVRRTRVERAALELREVQTRLIEAQERLAQATVKLARRNVVAPQDGIVLDLRYHTRGGVIPPGGEILDLVPVHDRLIIEARVNPIDIDVVRAGLPAQVVLSAYKSRVNRQLAGTVRQVSADTLTDQRLGQGYYLARIEIDPAAREQLGDLPLVPGMPAETLIETGGRTLLAYLAQPLRDSFRRSFRED